jgi:hypothetical protein
MQIQLLLPEQEALLVTLAEDANARLETVAVSASSQAFNVGCSVGLAPGLFIVVLSFFLSRGSFATTTIVAVLVLLILIIFANIIAMISRKKAVERAYQEQIQEEIKFTLDEQVLSEAIFYKIALQSLPTGSSLYNLIESQYSSKQILMNQHSTASYEENDL